MSSGLTDVSIFDCAFRVSAALVLGALIGFERQWRQRMAGLRTNALVATGSCLFVLMTPLVGAHENPLQIAAYVVSGIGFLAGGVIFKERNSVSGLNTAATLWCTAAIGCLVGFGFIWVAIIGVAAIMVANVALRPVVQRINRQPLDTTEAGSNYAIRARCCEDGEERIRELIVAGARRAGMSLAGVSSDRMAGDARVTICAHVATAGRSDARLEELVCGLGAVRGVTFASWNIVPPAYNGRDTAIECSTSDRRVMGEASAVDERRRIYRIETARARPRRPRLRSERVREAAPSATASPLPSKAAVTQIFTAP